MVNPVPVSLCRALGADIVIAVDLQHDAHLMQQDLFSIRGEDESPDDTPAETWRGRLRERVGRMRKRKPTTAPTAMEIMSTSIQMLENRLKRNRMASDPPDVLIQPFCPQISTLDFHRANEAIEAGLLAVEKQLDRLLPLIKNRQFSVLGWQCAVGLFQTSISDLFEPLLHYGKGRGSADGITTHSQAYLDR